MAQTSIAPLERVTGIVEAVNPKGVKINGEWVNFSRYAADIVPPMKGQAVTLTLDKQGFVRAVETQSASQEAPAGRPAPSSTKDRTITRLAILKAAAEFAASKPQSTSADVLKVAEAWERWVNRESDDLDEAF